MKKTIMLVCSAGMSTSMLVSKMKKAAEEKKVEAEIFALPASEAVTKLETTDIDVMLLGPQVRFMEQDFKKKVNGKIPVAVIDTADYGMMNGSKVLDFAQSLIEGK
ncbi:PTS sugar transporter subunit IIB [Clostridium sp. UBA1652]|uniref:PTS sugar transporter subunit IIB n=1 Tax=Clostridium sp. UBA1652 TaxID=1946348 RepID=UPI00257A3E64|nr:PTS sugar transporter subunit IIB [Clostridium sp. UBA1652]